MKAFILMLLMASYANAELVPNFVIKHEEPVMTSGNPTWKEVRSKDNECGLRRSTNFSRDWQYVSIVTSDASLRMAYQQVENDLSVYTVNYGYDRCNVTRKSDKVLSVLCKSGLFSKLSFTIFLNTENFIERVTHEVRYIARDPVPLPWPYFGSFDCRF